MNTSSATKVCHLCGRDDTRDFFRLESVPTQDGVMCKSFEEAKEVVRGDILLRHCNYCGYIGNELHDHSKVAFDQYDFSLGYSPSFYEYLKSVSNRLLQEYSLNGKTVVDIGCGDGGFLKLLCEISGCKGIGIDPGFDYSKYSLESDLNLEFRREYYGPEHQELRPDLVTCRLVLDLFSSPNDILSKIKDNLEGLPKSVVYFEVPDATYTFRERIVWNVVYEHRSWFTLSSLSYIFSKAGFEVLNMGKCWNNEFLYLEARVPADNEQINSMERPADQLRNDIPEFARIFDNTKQEALLKLKELRQVKSKVMGWGAGARAVTFFNLFEVLDMVPYIVDINSKRHHKFLPGSGQTIVPPNFIQSYQPDTIIITNPTYSQEIQEQVAELGLSPQFWIL